MNMHQILVGTHNMPQLHSTGSDLAESEPFRQKNSISSPDRGKHTQ
jgi:hypothetical protein